MEHLVPSLPAFAHPLAGLLAMRGLSPSSMSDRAPADEAAVPSSTPDIPYGVKVNSAITSAARVGSTLHIVLTTGDLIKVYPPGLQSEDKDKGKGKATSYHKTLPRQPRLMLVLPRKL